MDYPAILEDIFREVRPCCARGRVATYIPELAAVPPDRFGMAVHTVDGAVYGVGECAERFSVQSISKVFTLTLAMQLADEALWQRVGREPSGNPFNSLVQLEVENGKPRNPFINAGALVVTDVILARLADAKHTVRDFVRRLCGVDDIDFDLAVAHSEQRTGHRNKAMAHFLKSFGNLDGAPEVVLDAYFHHCSLAMSCRELCTAALFLANGGVVPASGDRVLSASQAKYVNSLLLTCGTYDAVGDFAYRVGLPGKSGVGGGILAVMPKRFSVCVWSPGLDEHGNSLAGTLALELFTTKTGISIF
ncbi:MAG: glutaminase [Deferrisomatales bacterium]|nr:glutaminase [Deferrisomatales bacterium]